MAGKVLTAFTNGWAGQVSRSIDDIIESIVNGEATAHIAFGLPVALNSGKVVKVSGTYTDVIGVACRTIKTENTYAQGDADYAPNEMVDVIKRGTVAVPIATGNPAAGGTVYITKATGAFAAASDSTNTIEMAGWKFKGPKDANNIVEIVLTERKY